MARLIDADALPVSKEYLVDEAGFGASFNVVHKSDIDKAPTVDAVEVRRGYINLVNRPISAAWVTVTTEHGEKVYGKLHDKIENSPVGYCSVCSKRLDDTFMHYCPNCGAKMDGERRSE